jgi:hypothetical protein
MLMDGMTALMIARLITAQPVAVLPPAAPVMQAQPAPAPTPAPLAFTLPPPAPVASTARTSMPTWHLKRPVTSYFAQSTDSHPYGTIGAGDTVSGTIYGDWVAVTDWGWCRLADLDAAS